MADDFNPNILTSNNDILQDNGETLIDSYDKKYIKRIKLSNGITYQICDIEAARAADLQNYLPLEGGTITGSLYVDNVMTANNLSIVSIEELELETPDYVLIQQNNESEIKKRNVDKLLEDIGGISYAMDDTTGTLSLKFGRQTE